MVDVRRAAKLGWFRSAPRLDAHARAAERRLTTGDDLRVEPARRLSRM
jgi:hypothetical protein